MRRDLAIGTRQYTIFRMNYTIFRMNYTIFRMGRGQHPISPGRGSRELYRFEFVFELELQSIPVRDALYAPALGFFGFRRPYLRIRERNRSGFMPNSRAAPQSP